MKCIPIGALFVKYFSSPPKQSPADCVRCQAGRGVKCSINSVGSLCLEPEQFVFTAKRLFRKRVHRIPLSQISGTKLSRGFLVDALTPTVNDYEQVFDVTAFVLDSSGYGQAAGPPHLGCCRSNYLSEAHTGSMYSKSIERFNQNGFADLLELAPILQ